MEMVPTRFASLPFDDQSKQATFQKRYWTLVTIRYLLIYFSVTAAAALAGHIFPLQDNSSIRKSLLVVIVLWFHRTRLMPYLPHLSNQAATHFTCWENVRSDLEFISVDGSPFWALEICRWIYSHFWGSLWIALKFTTCLCIGVFIIVRLPPRTRDHILTLCHQLNSQGTACRDWILIRFDSSIRFATFWLVQQRRRARFGTRQQVYTHKPLNTVKGHIRLVKLHRKTPLGDLTCDLDHVSLDEAPPFEAISYTWGNPELSHEILIGGSPYSVTANSYSALRSVHSVLHPKWLWIDSICIDQSNVAEKNQQILLMKDIYRRGSRVIVWLGDADDATLAFQLLAELGYHTQCTNAHELFFKYKDDINSPAWRALNKLVRSPWFDRVWVIQEVAVASAMQVHYGNRVLDWEELQTMFFTTSALMGPAQLCTFLVPQTESNGLLRDPLENHHAMTMNIFKRTAQGGVKLSLFACLELCLSFKATDPRDNVFALQALSAEGFTKSKPDYRKSVEQVYTDVTRDIISMEDEDRLSLLSLAGIGYPRAMTSLPSWVPEWGSGDRTTSFTNTGNRKERSIYDYQACGMMGPNLRLGSESNLLVVAGLRVDTIRSIGMEPPLTIGSSAIHPSTYTESDARLIQWRREAWNLAQRDTSRPYPTGEALSEAFWRTLMGNRLLSSEGYTRPAPAEYGAYFRAAEKVRPYRKHFYGASNLSNLELYRRIQVLKQGGFGSVEDYMECNNQGTKYEAVVGPHSYCRSFCCTSNGYMGLVSPGCKVGDMVCIIFGAQTPLILRRAEEDKARPELDDEESSSCLLVGESYFHGMMDGEKVIPGLPVQQFILR
jgi:Heterokaryon incompatibility protein (HET)